VWDAKYLSETACNAKEGELDNQVFEVPQVRDVLACCVRQSSFLFKCLALLDERYFVGDIEKKAFATLKRFYTKFNRAPTLEEFKHFCTDPDVDLQLQLISDEPKCGFDYLEDKINSFARRLALSKAIVSSVDLIEKGDFESVETLVRDALLVGTHNDVGLDYFKTLQERLLYRDRETVTTGIRDLDNLLRGGFGIGEIASVLGVTSAGKSMALIQFGRAALIAGNDVVEYTLELSDTEVGSRYDASISGVRYGKTKDNFATVSSKVGRFRRLTGGATLFIKEYPTKGVGVDAIRAHLRMVEAYVKPRLVLVDYADILKTDSASDKRYEGLQNIYEELRGLAMEFEVAVCTASQCNRDALSKVWIDLDNISESFGKAMVADVLIAINRTREEGQQNKARLAVVKNRTGPTGSFNINTKFENAVFATAEEVDQDEGTQSSTPYFRPIR